MWTICIDGTVDCTGFASDVDAERYARQLDVDASRVTIRPARAADGRV